jgi:hypothetical protein
MDIRNVNEKYGYSGLLFYKSFSCNYVYDNHLIDSMLYAQFTSSPIYELLLKIDLQIKKEGIKVKRIAFLRIS